MIKPIKPQKIVTGLRQVIFTFRETERLVWSANPRLLILSFLVNTGSGLLIFPTFYLEKLTIDALIDNIGNPLWQEALKTLSLLFFYRVTIGIFQSVLARISSALQHRVARVFSAHVDLIMGKKMTDLDIETIEDPVFQDRFNKVERESGRRSWGLAIPLGQIPNYFFGLASTVSILFLFNPLVAVFIFFLAIPEFLIDAKFTKKEYALETEMQPKYRRWGWMYYLLLRSKNFLELKILNLGPYFSEKISQISKEIFSKNFKLRQERETAHFLTFLPQNIFAFFFSIYLGYLTIIKIITVGSAQMYLRAIYSFQGNLTGLVGSFLELYENYLFVTDFVWFLNLQPKIAKGSKKFPAIIKDEIEFKNVWFRYKEDQPWVLSGINLKIKAKDNLAIVGENGAGKTTLIKLLCRFYDPQKGEILIDKVNITEFDRGDLWKNIGILFQNFEEFPFTARESIGYGRIQEVANLELIRNAAKKSAIDDYLNSLPLKYETPLDPDFDKGVRPSAGQWQRIGLARVLLRNAAILILDEPTSNVDPKSEEEIFEKIIKFAANKNLILISHRFSTVRRADKICVMDKGKIVEYGTHEELMKKKGIYAELFTLQAKSYQ